MDAVREDNSSCLEFIPVESGLYVFMFLNNPNPNDPVWSTLSFSVEADVVDGGVEVPCHPPAHTGSPQTSGSSAGVYAASGTGSPTYSSYAGGAMFSSGSGRDGSAALAEPLRYTAESLCRLSTPALQAIFRSLSPRPAGAPADEKHLTRVGLMHYILAAPKK